MFKTCQYLRWVKSATKGEGWYDETACDKPAVAHIVWSDEVVFHYCAEHYDQRIISIRESGKMDVLRLSGVK